MGLAWFFGIHSPIYVSIIYVAMWFIPVSWFALIISWLAVIVSWFDFSVSWFAVRMSWGSVVFGLVGGVEWWHTAVGSGCCVWASVVYGWGRWGERMRGRFLWVGFGWRGLSRVASSLVVKGRYGRRTWVKGKKNGLRWVQNLVNLKSNTMKNTMQRYSDCANQPNVSARIVSESIFSWHISNICLTLNG